MPSKKSPAPKNEDPTLTIEYIVTKGDLPTAEDFSQYIEQEALRRKVEYMEMILEYCEEKGIEPISIAKSITTSLKAKIEAEARDKNLLKAPKTRKLPS